MTSKNMRELSRVQWTTESAQLDDINSGSLLRIADAVEKMAQRHTELMEQRDRFERWYKAERETSARLGRQLSAAKGQITKLKKGATK